MDIIPIIHKDRVVNIITDLDLTFVELRGLLDRLVEENAFDEKRLEDLGPGAIFDIVFEDSKYVVDVYLNDVVIYKKEKAK